MPTDRSVVIDMTGVVDSKEVHARIERALGFPGYYGRDWDAFDECIRDMESPPSKISIFGLAKLRDSMPDEAELLEVCFRDYQRSKEGREVEVDIS